MDKIVLVVNKILLINYLYSLFTKLTFPEFLPRFAKYPLLFAILGLLFAIRAYCFSPLTVEIETS